MPHVDELLGTVTLAAAGLVVAIALQPVAGARVAPVPEVRTEATPAVASAGRGAGPADIVRLPAVEVVARRPAELAGIERRDEIARGRQATAAHPARPRA